SAVFSVLQRIAGISDFVQNKRDVLSTIVPKVHNLEQHVPPVPFWANEQAFRMRYLKVDQQISQRVNLPMPKLPKVLADDPNPTTEMHLHPPTFLTLLGLLQHRLVVVCFGIPLSVGLRSISQCYFDPFLSLVEIPVAKLDKFLPFPPTYGPKRNN